jgi:hypothetical protein
MPRVNRKNIFTSNADQDALTTDRFGDLILNFGDLTTLGDRANGIFASANDVTIRNFGVIETAGLGAAGIYVQGDNAHIVNFGSVHTTGDFTEDGLYFSEGLFAEGNGFHVANFGSILVEGRAASAMVGLGADGVVINHGHVDSDSADTFAIAVVSADRSQAINAGLMTIRGEDTTGIFASGDGSSAINRGTIMVTGSLNAAVEGALFSTHVTNEGVIRIVADDSIGMAGIGDHHEIENFGLIATQGTLSMGMVAGGGTDLELLNAGRILTEGDFAIGVVLGVTTLSFATGGRIVNSGVIETNGDGAAGIVMMGSGHQLTNSGRITADGGAFVTEPFGELRAAGVVVAGENMVVKNTRTGVITSADAASAAIELNVLEHEFVPAAGLSSSLENFGLIEGAAVAILAGVARETITNHGRIVGDVILGDGIDTFVCATGSNLAGDLFLGGDIDFVRVENGTGTTRIADFAAGDIINVSAFFSDFDDLVAHAIQRGSDVVIALDSNDTLILANLQISQLSAGDFHFLPPQPVFILGTAGDDHIVGTGEGYEQSLFGLDGNDILELPVLGGMASGDDGNDTLIGGAAGSSLLIGGADNDTLIGTRENVLCGDGDSRPFGAGVMWSSEVFADTIVGADILIGGANTENRMFGEGTGMQSNFGRDDTLTGGTNSFNRMHGDAQNMDDSVGGNDVMTGGANSLNEMFGEADRMMFSTGGDDTLTGGTNSSNQLIGDADRMFSSAGGDDRLISGIESIDHMWGDARTMDAESTGGADTFVFAGLFGDDVVYDFRPLEGDVLEIDIDGADWGSQVSWEVLDGSLYFDHLGERLPGARAVVTVAGASSSGTITVDITLSGIADLAVSNFLFV